MYDHKSQQGNLESSDTHPRLLHPYTTQTSPITHKQAFHTRLDRIHNESLHTQSTPIPRPIHTQSTPNLHTQSPHPIHTLSKPNPHPIHTQSTPNSSPHPIHTQSTPSNPKSMLHHLNYATLWENILEYACICVFVVCPNGVLF
uniref:Uncharacterized protein n=1 Tax=Amorphochlora amoebiformis TaxID=1561963 RepID=A0A7S0DEX5_9EUKA